MPPSLRTSRFDTRAPDGLSTGRMQYETTYERLGTGGGDPRQPFTQDHCMVTSAVALDIGTSRLPSTSRHRSYTLEFKLSVVEWVESQKCSFRAAAKQFGVDRKIVRSWVDSKHTLLAALMHHGPHKRKLHNGKPPASHELDQQVLEYLLRQRREGYIVGDKELQRQALECAERLGLAAFKATTTWLRGWKNRCCVEVHNGSNNVVVRPGPSPTLFTQVPARGSSLLSHVSQGDTVKLTTDGKGVMEGKTRIDENHAGTDGTVYMDFSSHEHNYCRTVQPSQCCTGSEDRDILNQSSTLQSDHSPFRDNDSANAKLPAVSPSLSYEGTSFFDAVIENIIVGDISELELPLGHEEVVGDSEVELLASLSPTRRMGSLREPRRKGRTWSRSAPSQRSETPVATFSMLDDPQGPSGLLASRLSQPVFPAGPEILYVDTTHSAYSTV